MPRAPYSMPFTRKSYPQKEEVTIMIILIILIISQRGNDSYSRLLRDGPFSHKCFAIYGKSPLAPVILSPLRGLTKRGGRSFHHTVAATRLNPKPHAPCHFPRQRYPQKEEVIIMIILIILTISPSEKGAFFMGNQDARKCNLRSAGHQAFPGVALTGAIVGWPSIFLKFSTC
jgi:hypothetical protein